MPDIPDPQTRITRYEVSCIPPDHIDADSFTIAVAWRGRDRWAVLLRGMWCLGTDGKWDHEPIPSERTDEWKATHRFDCETALKLAREAAPHVKVNGYTVADMLAREADDDD